MKEKDWSKEKTPENWTPGDAKEFISPEGVEEKIVMEDRFLITFTQGGKFRFYHHRQGRETNSEIFDNYGVALQKYSTGMGFMAALNFDAKKTIEMLISKLASNGDKK